VNKNKSILILIWPALALLNVLGAQGNNSAFITAKKELKYLTVKMPTGDGKYKYIAGSNPDEIDNKLKILLETKNINIPPNAKLVLLVDAHVSAKVVYDTLCVLNNYGKYDILTYSYIREKGEEDIYYVSRLFIEGNYPFSNDAKEIYLNTFDEITDRSTCDCQ